MSSHIVVGIDGSDDSLNAYRWALDEAHHRDAELTAMFAWEIPLIGIPGAFDRDQLEQEAQKFLNEQLDRAESSNGIAVNRIVAQGDPSTSLVEACKRVDAKLLVLGSRGRGGLGGRLLGSVGQECAAQAPCPVLICHAGTGLPD